MTSQGGTYAFGSFSSNKTELARLERQAAVAWDLERGMLEQAAGIIDALPPVESGKCVLNSSMQLLTIDAGRLKSALAAQAVRFHAGCLGGAYPRIAK